MADIVRLNQEQCNTAASDLRKKVNTLREYISGPVSTTVNSMGDWWIGDAYDSFKEDFIRTKDFIEKPVAQEIEAYIQNLEKAVAAQVGQDTTNAGTIGIN